MHMTVGFESLNMSRQHYTPLRPGTFFEIHLDALICSSLSEKNSILHPSVPLFEAILLPKFML